LIKGRVGIGIALFIKRKSENTLPDVNLSTGRKCYDGYDEEE